MWCTAAKVAFPGGGGGIREPGFLASSRSRCQLLYPRQCTLAVCTPAASDDEVFEDVDMGLPTFGTLSLDSPSRALVCGSGLCVLESAVRSTESSLSLTFLPARTFTSAETDALRQAFTDMS